MHQFKIGELSVENGKNEVWLFIEVKRLSNTYQPPPETPTIPQPLVPPTSAPPAAAASAAASGGAASSNSFTASRAGAKRNKSNVQAPTSAAASQAGATAAVASSTTTTTGFVFGSVQGATTAASLMAPWPASSTDPLPAPLANALTSSMTAPSVLQPNQGVSQSQLMLILAQQQQHFLDQQAAQQQAFKTALDEQVHKMNISMGQMYMNTFPNIPRGLTPSDPLVGPHLPMLAIGNGEVDEDDLTL